MNLSFLILRIYHLNRDFRIYCQVLIFLDTPSFIHVLGLESKLQCFLIDYNMFEGKKFE